MTDPYNTVSSFTYRNKYMSANLQEILKKALVAEKICQVDRSDLYTIQNPYGGTPTASVSSLTGTYSVSDYTTTNDALTVTEQIAYSEHIFRFESVMSNFDLFASRADALAYAVALAIDGYVINALGTDGTGTYSTPAGGFAVAANINTIMANLTSKVEGYEARFNGLFLVIEPTDFVGFQIAGATNGFTMSDNTLNNGFAGRWMGVDIYTVAASTFNSSTVGTKTMAMSGHRVFGVKNIATYASPRGVEYVEKDVTGMTGKEIAISALLGFKLWTNKAALIVDITLV